MFPKLFETHRRDVTKIDSQKYVFFESRAYAFSAIITGTWGNAIKHYGS